MKRSGVLVSLLLLLAPLPLHADAFKRGDANIDGQVDITDPLETLFVLFAAAPRPTCDDAMDANDDGRINLADVSYELAGLFTAGGAPPPAPYPDCGQDSSQDTLGCSFYPPCITCLTQADLDAAIAANQDSTVCVPADAAVQTILTFTITVCPAASAPDCGPPPAKGCPIQLTKVQGTLDTPGRKITIHVEGKADALPILMKDNLFGSKTTCLNDITFSGDAVIPIQVESPGPGFLRITAILDPTFENVDLTLTSSGGALCSIIQSNAPLLEQNLVQQLGPQIQPLIDELRAQLVGAYLCGN